MAAKGGGRIHTPIKPLEDSSLTYEESDDLSFQTSKLEELVKGFVRKVDLDDLKGELEKMIEGFVRMVDLVNFENKMEENMERIAKLVQKSEGKVPKGDDVARGYHEDKYSVHVDQASINTLRGFDSNNGSNQGWSPRGIQIPKINMRKFDGKGPITRIFQMKQFFDIH